MLFSSNIFETFPISISYHSLSFHFFCVSFSPFSLFNHLTRMRARHVPFLPLQGANPPTAYRRRLPVRRLLLLTLLFCVAHHPSGSRLSHLQAQPPLRRPSSARQDVPRLHPGVLPPHLLHGHRVRPLLEWRLLCGAERAGHQIHLYSRLVLVCTGECLCILSKVFVVRNFSQPRTTCYSEYILKRFGCTHWVIY